MSTQVQFRRGSTTDHSTFTGAVGEMTVDTTKDTLVVHDGATAGGFPLLREDLNNLADGSVGIAKINATGTADNTTFLRGDGTWDVPAGGGGGVTSVGLSLPAIFTVSGSPVTTTGTLTGTLATQTANTVWAGPTTGSPAAPGFRALVAADIPNLDAAKITTGTIGTARLGSGTADSTTFLRGDGSWQTVSGSGSVTSVGLSLPGIFSVTGSPVTTSGTLTATLASQAINTVWAGPASGGSGAPSFRLLVAADIPSHTHDAADVTTGVMAVARLGSGTPTSTTVLRGSGTWGGVPPAGSDTQIQFNSAGALAASSGLTFDTSSNGGLSVPSGHFIFGGTLPSRHTETTGYKAVWAGGNNTNAAIFGEPGAGFRGIFITANVVRNTSAANWAHQDTTQAAWAFTMNYESASTDYFGVFRSAATAGAWNPIRIFFLDRNLRGIVGPGTAGTTTGFAAKLAVDNVGGTASDSVLTLRGNASQSGNYFTAQTSGGTAVAQITSGGSLTINTAGQGLRVAEGSNAKQGTAVLVAGTVTVSNTSVTANSRIFLTSQSDGGTPGFLRVSARTAGTSFTITSSSGTDTSTVAYQIFEPA